VNSDLWNLSVSVDNRRTIASVKTTGSSWRPERLRSPRKNKLRFGHAAIEAIRFSWTISPTTGLLRLHDLMIQRRSKLPARWPRSWAYRSGGEQSEEEILASLPSRARTSGSRVLTMTERKKEGGDGSSVSSTSRRP